MEWALAHQLLSLDGWMILWTLVCHRWDRSLHTPDSVFPVDSKAFDVKAYYEQLITTASLTGLLKKENELAAGRSA
jgi:hypothetical protein